MPLRKTPLVTDEYYHILNRGTGGIPIFQDKRDYQRFIISLLFYQSPSPPIRFARFLIQSSQKRKELLHSIINSPKNQVEIITYCLMPNHFHLLLKQTKDKGIETLIRWVTNSYSRYFNTKYQRKGTLFEGRFKAIRVETDEQLLHLSRYIHLNPYSSYVVKTLKQLEDYPYSSFPEYIQKRNEEVCRKEIILAQFKAPQDYKNFVFNQADYQRNLEIIKHQLLE